MGEDYYRELDRELDKIYSVLARMDGDIRSILIITNDHQRLVERMDKVEVELQHWRTFRVATSWILGSLGGMGGLAGIFWWVMNHA